MADTKVSDLNIVTGTDTATGDRFVMLDVSDTSQGVGGTVVTITRAELVAAMKIQDARIGAFSSAFETKLGTIATGADVTDASSVAAAGAVMDGDFSSNGLLVRTGAGTYSVTPDNSEDWNTAFGWGNHASAGYASDSDLTSLENSLGDLATLDVIGAAQITSSAVETAKIQDGAVTNAKLANVSQGTLKGRVSAGTGAPTDLSPSDVRTLLNVADGADVTDATSVAAAGAVMDSDFSANGIMIRTGEGSYSSITNNSGNWNTAFGWGNHASAGYASDSDLTILENSLGELSTRDRASVAQTRSFTGDAGITAERLASAADNVTVSGTSNITLDMDTLHNGQCQLNGNRTFSLTNVQPGTYKEVTFYGNNSTNRTLTFSGSNWKGDLPTVIVNNTNKMLIGIKINTATEWLVTSVEYSI